jgi:hypothetical protein
MRIWADAARWSQDQSSSQFASKAKAQFHGWWVRAAFAMGNNVWLKTEHVNPNGRSQQSALMLNSSTHQYICVDKHAGRFQQWKVNQLRTASGYKTISTISTTKVYDKKFSAEAMEQARREQKGAWDDIPSTFFAAPVSSEDLK